jgi:hypothetical protein
MVEEDELDKTRGVLGFHYLLPLNIESRIWVDSDGGSRINFDKEFELTPRLMLFGEAKYDTHISSTFILLPLKNGIPTLKGLRIQLPTSTRRNQPAR